MGYKDAIQNLNMRKTLVIALAVFLMVFTVKASADWDFFYLSPPNHFSVSNGTQINFSAYVYENVTSEDVNGTICITYDIATNSIYCVNQSGFVFGLANFDVSNMTTGSHSWKAEYTHNDSTGVTSATRNYNVIITDRIVIPISPINNATVTGDSTDYKVTYEVDLYLPYEIRYNLYIRFYAYNSYLGLPLPSSERLICSVKVEADSDSPISAGTHRYNCTNHMYQTYEVNYHELPDYHFWRAKLKLMDNEAEGTNLLSDTGYQDYTYQINTNFDHVYPPDDTEYCDYPSFYANNTLLVCGTGYRDVSIPFYSYLRDNCGGGNITWNYINTANSSQSGTAHLIGIPNLTEDYFEVGLVFPYAWTNQTYETPNFNWSAVTISHNWTYDCNNGSTYQTGNNDINYIVGISVVGNITVGYPTYPLPIINQSAIMPYFAGFWGDFFGGGYQVGLMLIALFFILALTIFVTINSDVIGGGGVAIFGTMVFVRLGYIHIIVMGFMLVLSGITVVYIVRKVMLHR